MDELPPITVPSLRVTDVAATDLTQHLALPVTYAPDQDGNAYAELASKDMPLSNDRSTVQQVVQLLNSTDIRYLKMRTAPNFTGLRAGPLRMRIQQMAPNLFMNDTGRPSGSEEPRPDSTPTRQGQQTPQGDVEIAMPAVRTPGMKRKLKASTSTFQPPAMFGCKETPEASPTAPTPRKGQDSAQRPEAAVGVSKQPEKAPPAQTPAASSPAEIIEQQKATEQAKLKERTWTTTQAEAVEDVNLADNFSRVVSRVLEKAKAIEESLQYDGGEADACAGEIDEQELHKRCLPLEDIKALNVEAMRIADAGMLKEVNLDDMVEIIALMHNHVKVGCSPVIQDDDDESSDSVHAIMLSAEACLVILHLMTGDELAMEIFNEDAIEKILEFVSHHLKYNIYVFYDIIQRQKFRPNTCTDTDEQRAAKRAKLGKKRAGMVVSNAAKAVTTRVEAILGVLHHLFSRVTIQSSQLNTLINSVLQALTIEGIELLQLHAIAVLVALFQEYPNQRKGLFEALIGGVLFNTPLGRSARKYMVPSEDDMYILPVSALVIQCVQVSCRLPAQDGDHSSRMGCFAPAITWADAFWGAIFDQLPHAKAQKSDTEYDMRALVEMIMMDLLSILHLPDWPAASTILLRFVTILAGPKGLQYNDGPVRQACIDLLGQVASHVAAEVAAADADTEWMESIIAQSTGRPGVAFLGNPVQNPSALDGVEKADALGARGQWLLLDHLAQGPSSYYSAAIFNLCHMFSDEMRELVRGDGDDPSNSTPGDAVVGEEGASILAQYRQIASGELQAMPCKLPEGIVLGRAAACHVARFVFKRSALGKGGPAMLKWIIDMLDRTKQVPGTRAKAVKALGAVVEADTRLLSWPEVKIGVNRSLHDDAISVREAAVDLLGKHIGNDRDLAMTFFDLIGQAANDAGTSVRKRAVKILWESCIRIPDFPRATEACIRVLQRVSDPEESIHNLVGKIFHDLWFSASTSDDTVIGSPSARAHQLADVAVSIYEGTGSNIHLPLGRSHPLVAVVVQAVEPDQKSDHAKALELEEGAAIADALLEEVLSSEDRGTSSTTTGPFTFLLALHAFATADARLVSPQSDPVKFLRHLSPYLKRSDADGAAEPPSSDPDEHAAHEATTRRDAEQTICILHIINSLLGQLESVPRALLDDLLRDLTSLIQRHKFVQVVAASCECLGSLAHLDSRAAKHTVKVGLAVFNKLRSQLKALPSAEAGASVQAKWAAAAGRLLYMLGQICRFAVGVLEKGKSPPLAMRDALAVAIKLFHVEFDPSQNWAMKLKDNALQAAGLIFIAHPTLMVKSEADGLVSSTISVEAPAKLKIRCLGNLLELLKSEEDRLLVKQKDGDEEVKEKQMLASSGIRVSAAVALQTQNGEGDSVSLASGLIQRYWDRVLKLATDVPIKGENTREDAQETVMAVRQRAFELMEAVLRAGLVAPWTAVPHMVALSTDPSHALAQRARRVLRLEAEKHAAFFDGRLAEGIEVAFRFHKSLAISLGQSVENPHTMAEIVKGVSQIYSGIIQQQRNVKINFLATILKRFEAAVDMSDGAESSDLGLLKFLAAVPAALPFKKADEPLSIVHSINGLVSRRAEFVRTNLKMKLQAAKAIVQPSPAPAAASGGPSAAPATPAGNPTADGEASEAQPEPAASATPNAMQIDRDAELQATQGMVIELKAAYAVSLLLELKQYIKAAYKLDNERIANFSPYGEKRKTEERMGCSKGKAAPLSLSSVPVLAFSSLEHAAGVYQSFKSLMSSDTADYGEGVSHNVSKKTRRALDSIAEGKTPGEKRGRGRSRKSIMS